MRYINHTVEVDVDICVDDVLEELANKLEISELIGLLSDKGCPLDIIQQIKEWDRAVRLDPLKLESWTEFANR